MSPSRPPRPCKKPGCPGLAYHPSQYCANHVDYGRAQKSADSRAYDGQRGSPSERGYGGDWRALRAQVLAEEPRCSLCNADGRPDDHVDHVLGLKKGGTNARANLRRVCRPCHSRKTIAEDGGWGKS